MTQSCKQVDLKGRQVRNNDDRRHLALEVIDNEGLQPLGHVLLAESAPANKWVQARGAGGRVKVQTIYIHTYIHI